VFLEEQRCYGTQITRLPDNGVPRGTALLWDANKLSVKQIFFRERLKCSRVVFLTVKLTVVIHRGEQ